MKNKTSRRQIKLAPLLLRAGLVWVFLYAGISSLQHPLIWVGFLPNFMTQAIAATTLIKFFALFELALSLWIASGKWLSYSALLATLTLAGITILNPAQLITTFRDIGLACMALALFFSERDSR